MTAQIYTKPYKYVISSTKNSFYSLNKAKAKILEYYEKGKLNEDALIYEVRKSHKPVIISEIKILPIK